MITRESKRKFDQLWNALWGGGIANALSVIEQITDLLFVKRLALTGKHSCECKTLSISPKQR